MTRIYYLFIICCLFASCDIINPEEDIPAFIEIESFELLPTPDSGSINENITEGWVFVDNVLIGAFSEGKPFPVLAEGSVELIIDPGVHENGISFTPRIYPYYTRYRATIDLVPGQVTTINPKFEYQENVEFQFLQDFENNTIFTFDLDGNDETMINFTNDGALEGVSAIIELNQENSLVNVATNTTFALPTFGVNDAWLEINFKTDVPIAIGLLNQNSSGDVQQLYGHGLNISPDWKKVYINLAEIILNNPDAPYQVGFAASLPIDQPTGTIMIDNIKLLHFKE